MTTLLRARRGVALHLVAPQLQLCPVGQGEQDMAPPVEKVSSLQEVHATGLGEPGWQVVGGLGTQVNKPELQP